MTPISVRTVTGSTAMAFFGPLGARTQAVIDQFSPAEQELILRFITAAADSMNAHLAELKRQSGWGRPPPRLNLRNYRGNLDRRAADVSPMTRRPSRT